MDYRTPVLNAEEILFDFSYPYFIKLYLRVKFKM